ncbi:MAG: hypothetical protein ABI461_15330 [Polyangiaceae bacterium]
MKTNHEVASTLRRFSAKTILGVFFVAGALSAATGCSADAQSIITHQSCASLTTSHGRAPSVQVSVKSNGSSPDVAVTGNGFPPGSRISVGYFGLPPENVGGATVQLDVPALGEVNADGTFSITQRGVYDVKSCASDEAGDTIAIAVGAGGTVAGTSAPARFWCENAAATASYDGPCE